MRSRFSTLSLFPMLLTGFFVGQAAVAESTTLNVQSWGGDYHKAWVQAADKPFTQKTGITFNYQQTSLAKLRAGTEANKVVMDVIEDTPQDIHTAMEEGLLTPIDISTFPPGILKSQSGVTRPPLEDFIGLLAQDGKYYSIPTISWSTYVAFDKTRYPKSSSQPTQLADFFDLKRFPGRRGLYKARPCPILEMALYADGVAADKVFDVLATTDGQDRAFNKIAQLKGNIIWWQAGAQPPQLLADHEVVMTTAWNGDTGAAILHKNMPFGEIWDGFEFDYGYFAIPKGAPHAKAALEYINYASSTHPLSNLTKYIPYGPLRHSSQEWVDPAIRPMLPSSHMEHAIKANTAFWADHGDALNKRWENFVAQS